ncbi:hypothetical protein [Rhodococcus sp. NPDC058521]|uniref:helix-turn-helix domain-containing protein n=1 Tax=Rhodococcus sp. NPDC058521 TaxID=3346536 RepID=UPI0036650B53
MSTPPVQRLGRAVLLQGRALDLAYLATAATTRILTERHQPIPGGMTELVATLKHAVSQQRHNDDAPTPRYATSEHDRITVSEAAELLGVTPRTVQRLARTLEGRKFAGCWTFDPALVTEYRSLRNTH